jgi:ERF superfamily protein
MRRSDSIVELVKALAAAQKEIEAPKKNATGQVGTRNYKYSNLAEVRDAYRGPLSKHGLIIAHTLTPVDGHVVLATSLLHTSGEWIASDYPIPSYDKPQEQGSALTYFKRYNVCALLDIVAEDDDDGATAQAAKQKQEPVSAEAAAIHVLAGEIADLTDVPPEQIIKEASAFTSKDGKLVEGFTDPSKVKPGKWLSMTKTKLEKRLHDLQMANEPGAEEGAALLT